MRDGRVAASVGRTGAGMTVRLCRRLLSMVTKGRPGPELRVSRAF